MSLLKRVWAQLRLRWTSRSDEPSEPELRAAVESPDYEGRKLDTSIEEYRPGTESVGDADR